MPPKKTPDYGAITQDSPDVYIPTPEEIAREAAKIRATWQKGEKAKHIHCKTPRSGFPRVFKCAIPLAPNFIGSCLGND